MIFWQKWTMSQICNQYALRNFLRCITYLQVKNLFHIRHIFEFQQPRGNSWRGYATQEVDQEFKWKLRTLSVRKNWVWAFLGPQSWHTRLSITVVSTPPASILSLSDKGTPGSFIPLSWLLLTPEMHLMIVVFSISFSELRLRNKWGNLWWNWQKVSQSEKT